MKVHKSITGERIAEACERHLRTLDNPGFCVLCGEEAEGVDPDARRGECEHCGKRGVYGADELAIHMF